MSSGIEATDEFIQNFHDQLEAQVRNSRLRWEYGTIQTRDIRMLVYAGPENYYEMREKAWGEGGGGGW